MTSWTQPTRDEVELSLLKLVRNQHRRYFFSHLRNPLWLRPLADQGVFEVPPEPVKEADGAIWFPTWPESQYLARVAPEVPELAMDVTLGIPETENIRVREDCLDVALAVPPSIAEKIVSRATRWITHDYHLLLPDKTGRLAVYLADGGYVDSALALVRNMLRFRQAAQDLEQTDAILEEARPIIASHDYERFLERDIASLASLAPADVFKALLTALWKATAHYRSRHAQNWDGSEYWRPAVADHEQNEPKDGLASSLVAATRDAMVLAVRCDQQEALHSLALCDSSIFRRLELHLASEQAPEIAAALLTDRELFSNAECWHEYCELCRRRFGALASRDKALILGWIEEGPDYIDSPGPDLDAWQLRRLLPLRDDLQGAWKERLEHLVRERGEPEHYDFPFWSSGVFIGPTSPLTVGGLGDLSVPELAEYLAAWSPGDDFAGPSAEGLSRVLSDAVASNPVKYARSARLFSSLRPPYIRGLLIGLADAARADKSFPWTPVLDLANRITSQLESEPTIGSAEWHDENHYTWAKSAVAELVSAGANHDLLFPRHQQRWLSLLQRLLSGRYRDEDYYSDHDWDSYTKSINTVRGKALHATIDLGLWVRRNQARKRRTQTVKQVIEALLHVADARIETSPVLRSVIGARLRNILFIDESVTNDMLKKAFPVDEDLAFWPAWSSFVEWNPAIGTLFSSLQSAYEKGVGDLRESDDQATKYEARLTQHIMTLFWFGELEPWQESTLLREFFENSGDRLWGEAWGFAGTRLVPPVPVDAIEDRMHRLTELWRQRYQIATADPSSHVSELAAYASLFCRPLIEEGSSLEYLANVLVLLKDQGKAIDERPEVLQRLAELAPMYPDQVGTCLELLLENGMRYGVLLFSDEVRAALAALQQGGREGVLRSRLLADELGAKGFMEFEDFA